jgi:hypothetical protein
MFKRCSTCFGQNFAYHQEHFWTVAAGFDYRIKGGVAIFSAVVCLLTNKHTTAGNTSTSAFIRETKAAAAVQKCSWWWAKYCPKHVEQRLNNKRFYNRVCIRLVILFEDLKMHETTSHQLMHKIVIYLFIIHLLKSCTRFEHYPAHLQDVYVVTVYMQPLVSSLSVERELSDITVIWFAALLISVNFVIINLHL